MLTSKQKQHLRAKAHKLKPVVIIGNAGLTENVLAEIELTIEHHELIKVKINATDRDQRRNIINAICEHIHCENITSIGHIAVLYRQAKIPKLML